MSRHLEVAIVGAGPAGLSTALHLLRLNPSWAERMIVLEKEAHPRHKLCAGGITPFGLARLRGLGLRLGVTGAIVEEARLRYLRHELNVSGRPAFVVIKRSEFDAWLAEEARKRGVRLMENSPVRRLQRVEAGIWVETPKATYLASSIVGADGSRGIVRPWIGARERPPHVARLLEVVGSATGHESEFAPRSARFDFSYMRSNLQGYFWVFPSFVEGEACLNQGVFDARMDARKKRAALSQILRDGMRKADLPAERVEVEGHPIHWFSPANVFARERVLLVGDAAGADPLFGEGISPALGYGSVAARCLQRAFLKRDFRFNDYRRRLLFSPVGRYLLLRWLAASMVYRLGDADLFMRAVWRLGGILASMVAGRGRAFPEVYAPGAGSRSGENFYLSDQVASIS